MRAGGQLAAVEGRVVSSCLHVRSSTASGGKRAAAPASPTPPRPRLTPTPRPQVFPHRALFGSLFRKPGSALLPLTPRGRHVSRAALAVPLALALLGWASLVLARLRGRAAPESAAAPAELPTGCVAGAFFQASHAAPCELALEPTGRPVRVSLAGEARIVGLHREFIELECRADHAGLRAGWRRFLGEQGVPRRFHACPPAAAAERALAAVPAVSERNWGWKDRNGFPTDYPPAPIDCLLEDGSAAGVRPVHVAAGQAAGGRAVAVRCRFPLEGWRVTGAPAAAAEEGERLEEAAFAEPTPAVVDSGADSFRPRLTELGAPTPRAQPSTVDAVAPQGGGDAAAAAAASDHEAPLLELVPTAAQVR